MRDFLLLSGFLLLGLASQISAQGSLGGFAVPPDTVPDLDIEYVPTQKSQLFKGKPGKAALYSLILPGAGQVYNGKIWKVPIVYAAIGTAGYFMIDNSKTYRDFREAYEQRLTALEEGIEPYDQYYMHPTNGTLSPESIRIYRDQYNRYRQINIVIFALTWIANSAEAFVDGHLSEFDIDENLSLQFYPETGNVLAGSGIGASLTYKF